MTAYYNENDPKAAAWLRELIKDGHIANGIVDERSIKDVQPNDIKDFTQCHHFAGIGGWSYALRLAGWPDDRAVWTGSCPCQPFSAAGQKGGTDDARHLWPEFYRLIAECRPPVVFGEQVASKDGLDWLDIVSTDLERADYAIGAADLCAAGVGAPHIRQRLYFVADSNGPRLEKRGANEQRANSATAVVARGDASIMGDAAGEPSERHAREIFSAQSRVDGSGQSINGRQPIRSANASNRVVWAAAEFIQCTDGKARPIEPGTFPLAHGIPHRVGLLRGYGNAIVPQVAAAFIKAYLG